MRQSPKCGSDATDSLDAGDACRTPPDGVQRADCPAELPVVAVIAALSFRLTPSRSPAGVPRRFSIGTLMILVTAFAVLFAVLKTVGADPAAFVIITVFVGGIAACQSLLFKGKMPRLASFVGGMILYSLATLLAVIEDALQYSGMGHRVIETAIEGMFVAVIVGGPVGYIVGCFIASIFLVRKEPDDSEATSMNSP
jgi:hypothetical protein